MTLPTVDAEAYHLQATLALQHVERIVSVLKSKNTTGGGWSGWCEGGVAWWVSHGKETRSVEVIREAWRMWAEEVGTP